MKLAREQDSVAKRQKAKELLEKTALEMEQKFTWEERRLMTVHSFANWLQHYGGQCRSECIWAAALSNGVSEAFAWKWCLQYEANEGFFDECRWGTNVKTAWALADVDKEKEVKLWLASNCGHRRKEPNLTAQRFQRYLKEEHNIDVCKSTATSYLHRLGAGWEEVKKNSFVDNHESEDGLKQEKAFLAEYAVHYKNGPNYIDDIDKDRCLDTGVWSECQEYHERGFGLGGQRHSTNKASAKTQTTIIVNDDEVCIFSGEGERGCWRLKGATSGDTPSKNKGGAEHVAGIAMEVGNGRLSQDHGGKDGTPPSDGGLLRMNGMVSYIDDKHSGKDPVIPRHADVVMQPGKNHDGYWQGEHKAMQMELAADIFNLVFNTSLDLSVPVRVSQLQAALNEVRASRYYGDLPYLMAAQLDRSQNHLAMGEEALCASNMRASRGPGKNRNRPHIRPTYWIGHAFRKDIRAKNCLADGSCTLCKADQAEAAANGKSLNLQVIGWKGVDLVLEERHMPTSGLLEAKQARLANCPDFKAELSKVQRTLQEAGHVGFFGAICHAELAHIERKWARIKSYIKPQIDDTRATLLRLMDESFSRQTVLEVQKDARACREVMHAYRLLRQVRDTITPDDIKAAVAVQKQHRCEVKAEAGVLKLLLQTEMSEKQQKAANALLARRANRIATEKSAEAHARKVRNKRKSSQNKQYNAVKQQKRAKKV